MTYFEMVRILADVRAKRPEVFAWKTKEATLAAVAKWHYTLKDVSVATVMEAIKVYIEDNGKAPDLVDVCAELGKIAEYYDTLARFAYRRGDSKAVVRYLLLASDARSYRLPSANAV